MKKPTISKLSISIKDISDGQGKAFVAILHDFNNAKVLGKDYRELFKGIQATIEYKTFKKIIQKRDTKDAKFVSHKDAWA